MRAFLSTESALQRAADSLKGVINLFLVPDLRRLEHFQEITGEPLAAAVR